MLTNAFFYYYAEYFMSTIMFSVIYTERRVFYSYAEDSYAN
jgi:hypothetical protein